MQGQRIRPFVGINFYRETNFNNSIIGSLNTGIEIRVFNFFRPQFEVDLMYGKPEPSETFNDSFVVQNVTYRKVSAINYSFCPKINIGNSDDSSDGMLIILPRYTCSQVMGSTESYTRSSNQQTPAMAINKSTTTLVHSIGIGIGFLFDITNTHNHAMAITLNYNGVNLGSALKKLDDSSTINTSGAFGIGLNIYFGGKIKE